MIEETDNTNNPIAINFIAFKNIWQDLKKCRTWKDRLRIIFGGLTWRPDYFNTEEKTKADAPLKINPNKS